MALYEQDPHLWHQKGLHTLSEVEAGDRPAGNLRTRRAPEGATTAPDRTAELQRMDRYLRRMREEQGKEER